MADNPDFRYVVGKDAAMMLEAKRNIPNKELRLNQETVYLQNFS